MPPIELRDRCIDEWLEMRDLCPICKVTVSADAGGTPRAQCLQQGLGQGERGAVRESSTVLTAGDSLGIEASVEGTEGAASIRISRLFGLRPSTRAPGRGNEGISSGHGEARRAGTSGVDAVGVTVWESEADETDEVVIHYANPLFGSRIR